MRKLTLFAFVVGFVSLASTAYAAQPDKLSLGVSVGSAHTPFSGEADVTYLPSFADHSLWTAFLNARLGVSIGPVQPFVTAGFGAIRSHVTSLGYDYGVGVDLMLMQNVGIRGDIRKYHAFQSSVGPFTGQTLDYPSGSVSVVLKF